MKFFCPRSVENGGGPDSPFQPPFNGEATWREDDACSYCGSLHPDTFMARLEAGDVELVPTDKSYKAYVKNLGGAAFRQTYRDCPPGSPPHMPDQCDHWTTREIDQQKFYFQHLSADQRGRLIDLVNAGKIKFGYPGYFYVLPYFVRLGP